MPKYFYFKNDNVVYITAKSLEDAKSHSNYVGRTETLFEDEYKFDYWIRKNNIYYDEAESESDIFSAFKSTKQRWHHFYANKLKCERYPYEDAIHVHKGISFGTMLKRHFDYVSSKVEDIRTPQDFYHALIKEPIVIVTKLK